MFETVGFNSNPFTVPCPTCHPLSLLISLQLSPTLRGQPTRWRPRSLPSLSSPASPTRNPAPLSSGYRRSCPNPSSRAPPRHVAASHRPLQPRTPPHAPSLFLLFSTRANTRAPPELALFEPRAPLGSLQRCHAHPERWLSRTPPRRADVALGCLPMQRPAPSSYGQKAAAFLAPR
jgi:hypothetical protein